MTYNRLGTGIRFPLLTASGFGWVSEAEAVEQAIRAILLSEPGERLARPNFGVGLRRFLFANNSVELRTRIRTAISDALQRDEARISLVEVEVSSDPATANVLQISINYSIRDLPGSRNLVFPFYLQGLIP